MPNTKRIPEVRGAVLKKAREAKELTIAQLATKVCLSVKQIEQLESGDRSHFYSLSIKTSAAKRVADELGVGHEEIFDFGPDLVQEALEADKQLLAQNEIPASVELTAGHINQSIPNRKVEHIERFSEPAPSPQVLSKSRMPILLAVVVVIAVAGVVLTLSNPAAVSKKDEPAKLPSEAIVSAPEQKKEESSAPTILPVAPPMIGSALTTPSIASMDGCPAEDGSSAKYRTPAPSKAGNMVYVLTRTKQTLCIKDATGKLEKKSLEEGGAYSFYGKAPFLLMTAGLGQTDIFFQGYKVRVDIPAAKSIVLEEVAF